MSTLPPHRVLILVNSASCRNSGNRCYTDSVIPLLRNASIETIVHGKSRFKLILLVTDKISCTVTTLK